VELDGKQLPALAVPLLDDDGVHDVRVTLGPGGEPGMRQ
jgi:hypothetical protein